MAGSKNLLFVVGLSLVLAIVMAFTMAIALAVEIVLLGMRFTPLIESVVLYRLLNGIVLYKLADRLSVVLFYSL